LNQEGIDPEAVLRTGLRCYLKMVFTDGLFHGDLHAGNMFVLPNNRIGLIDFGAVGRLNKKTQSAIANMLVALATEDYDRLAYEYVDMAPYAEGVDVDLFARDLRDLIAPYYGLTLKHVNVGKLLMESAALAARYRLRLPSELIMFFKSIMTIEGMGRVIVEDFNFLMYSLEFASELVQSRAEPARVLRELSSVGRDVNALMVNLPRQLRQLLRRLMSPDFALKMEVRELEQVRETMRKSSQLLFTGLIVSALLISAAMLHGIEGGPHILGIPVISALHYGAALVLLGTSFFKR
jgi:ubiquinone biosynthesis protein